MALSSLPWLRKRMAFAAPVVLRHAQDAADPFGRQAALGALATVEADVELSFATMSEALGADEPGVRSAAAQALGELGAAAAPAAADLAMHVLTDENLNVRVHAAMTLAAIGPPAREAAATLAKLGDDAPFLLRTHAAFALARTAPDEEAPHVARLISLIGADPYLGMVPVHDIGKLGATARPAEGRLLEMLRSADRPTWYAVVQALVGIGDDGAKEAVDDVVRRATTKGAPDDDWWRTTAIRTVSALPQHAARFVPLLVAALESKSEEDVALRAYIAQSLGSFGTAAAPAVPSLMRLRRDADPSTRHAAESAILDIGR